MNGDSKGLNVIASIGSSGEIRKIELNLIPTLIESHWHSTDEWFDSSSRLVI